MQVREFSQGRSFMGRLPKGDDLLDAIQDVAKKVGVTTAKIDVIGAVEKAVIGFYDMEQREYKSIPLNKNLEIVQAGGNISLKDGQVIAHVHITLGDREGHTYSGHLMKGTRIFAGEIIIQELIGPEMHRKYDEPTGLPLWDL